MNILIINTINKLYNEANLSQDNYLSLCKQPITLPKKNIYYLRHEFKMKNIDPQKANSNF